ncbi:urease accessory protein UreE [Halobacteriales archaeon QS_6_64_34]|nr:MAG: urease accessory protein UreE [Halobacteriales archaeon QS_6_64_34]
MRVADTYLGNRSEDAVAEQLADAESATVVLSDTERQRSRVRTETTDGQELGVVVAEELAGGDVLEADDGTLVVVELAAVDVLVIDIDGSDMTPTAALEVGHALGNRHWDMALRDGEALFPVPDSRARMTATVEEVLPAGVETGFESVPPTTFDDTDDHGHAHAAGHGADGDHDHGVHTIDGGDP